jgi:hypothetical protein
MRPADLHSVGTIADYSYSKKLDYQPAQSTEDANEEVCQVMSTVQPVLMARDLLPIMRWVPLPTA